MFGMTVILTINIWLINWKFIYFGEGLLIYNYLQDSRELWSCGAHCQGWDRKHTCQWREEQIKFFWTLSMKSLFSFMPVNESFMESSAVGLPLKDDE